MPLSRACLAALFLLVPSASAQTLMGHGGPVGALDANAEVLVSGGFDTRAILWDLGSATAQNVTRFHDGNVTAVALLPDGGFVTTGQDGRIAIWQDDARDPDFASDAGVSAIASLDVSPDGTVIGAGLWDGRILLLDRAQGEVRAYQAHSDRVTGLGFLPEGDLVSVGGDLRLARWSVDFQLQARVDLTDLPNGLAISQNRVAVIFAEGALRLFSAQGDLLPERFLTDRPLVALAATETDIAAAAIDGTVWLLQPRDLAQRQMFSAANGPVWGLALNEKQVFTAGADGAIRRWGLEDGRALDPDSHQSDVAFTDDSRGAEIWQACAVCHSLQPDDHSRAGPGLHGIFGQQIASQPGYEYSDALQELDIIWTPQTVAELFEFGPEAYTPGSRMPEQRIADPQDRQALVEFLARAAEQTGQ